MSWILTKEPLHYEIPDDSHGVGTDSTSIAATHNFCDQVLGSRVLSDRDDKDLKVLRQVVSRKDKTNKISCNKTRVQVLKTQNQYF